VILFGADRYRRRLPRSDGWILWDKTVNTAPADFAVGEWIWTNLDIAPQVFSQLWRGGMRAGEANMARLRHKYHPAQKAPELMQHLVRLITPGLTVIDPYMGSGSTLVACVREGYPCIGIEMDAHYFQIACTRVEEALQQLTLFA
jgi:DNA modification methylase